MLISGHKQRGLTLIELMVGAVVSLLVMAGVFKLYIFMLRSSSDTLQSTRLNQEMSAVMNIMVNDIRRAGFWGGGDLTAPENNPFSQVNNTTVTNTTSVRVHSTDDHGASYVDNSEEAVLDDRQGSCIVYTYDANRNGSLDDTEKFGFRWDGQTDDALMMRTSSNAGSNICVGNSGSWSPVIDKTGSIEVTNLNFSLAGSKCVNLSEPDGIDEDGGGEVDEPDEYNCNLAAFAADAGEKTVENIEVRITLEAQLADDPEMTATMTQSVQVRNYLVRVR